jgi:hypothetical protein
MQNGKIENRIIIMVFNECCTFRHELRGANEVMGMLQQSLTKLLRERKRVVYNHL